MSPSRRASQKKRSWLDVAMDLDAYCALEADPEVRRYVGGGSRRHEAAVRLKKAYPNVNGAQLFALLPARGFLLRPNGFLYAA